MAIGYLRNALGGTTTTTSFTITLPETAAGNLIIIEFTHRGTGNGAWAGTYDGPAFQQKHEQPFATSLYTGQSWWSIATKNHTGQTVIVSSLTNSCAGICTVYSGADVDDPLGDAVAIVGEQNASGNETQAQITTQTDGAYVVLCVSNSPDYAVSSEACVTLGNLTERAERLSTGGTDTSIAHSSLEMPNAGATGAFTWAQTNSASGSWAYAIKPAPSTQTFQVSVTDGTKFGEASKGGAVFQTAVTDGWKSGDNNTKTLKSYGTAADGVYLGDLGAIALVIAMLAADGIKFGDLTNALAQLNLEVTDGVKFGDVLSVLATFGPATADGIKFGDLVDAASIYLQTFTDGMKFGDLVSALVTVMLEAADGVKFGDATTLSRALSTASADGAKFGDVTSMLMAAGMQTVDGIEFGDLVSKPLWEWHPKTVDGMGFGDSADSSLRWILQTLDRAYFGDAISVLTKSGASVTDGVLFGTWTKLPAIAVGLLKAVFNSNRPAGAFAAKKPSGAFAVNIPLGEFTEKKPSVEF